MSCLSATSARPARARKRFTVAAHRDVVSFGNLGSAAARNRRRLYTVHVTQDTRSVVDPVIEVYKKDIDRTLLRENLKLSVEDRLRQLMELQRFAEELQRAGRAARRAS